MKVRKSVYFDPVTLKLLDHFCKEMQISRSSAIRLCVNNSLKSNTFVV